MLTSVFSMKKRQVNTLVGVSRQCDFIAVTGPDHRSIKSAGAAAGFYTEWRTSTVSWHPGELSAHYHLLLEG